ncbi:TonB-dependent receptor [Polymorphobacter fuscus]|uniref:TonB-dependent receptor n=1 Tax=Sandarakinorhabdus fusca TaxID=1439888 RepID=UPI001FB0C52E|nr:TonB-dependent receptor [Polymorphobacter fuscus]
MNDWIYKTPRLRGVRLGLLLGVTLMAPAAALAQAATDEGEIIVTALRRDTRIQETPLAISAVTGAMLERSGTTSFTDLTRNAPSLRIVDSGPGNRRVLIRGIQSSGEPTVGVYFDETPVSGSVSTSSDAAGSTPDFRLFDVERAEVLRGPRGTLFGSGSMGGTLRVIFEKPKSDRVEAAFSANMSSVRSGGYGGSVDGMINLPVVEDKVAVRLVGFYNRFAGYVDNIVYRRNDINDGRSYGGRALVRITPVERLTVDLSAFFEDVATDSPRWVAETGIDYATDGRSASGNYDRNRMYNGTVRYDFDAFTLTGVSSYFDRSRTVVGDVSDTFNGRDTAAGCRTYLQRNARACTDAELPGYLRQTREIQVSSLYQPQNVKNWINELRVSSAGDGAFNWTAGLFMEDRKTVVRSTLVLGDPQTGQLLSPTDPYNIRYDRTINDKLKQKAAFIELSYKFFDKLTLTAGTRYFDFNKVVGGRIDQGQIHYSSVVTPYQEVNYQEDGFIYKFNLSYQHNRDILVYAQAAQGFRPGGVNQVIGLPAELAGYSSDSLWNYELGVKTTLAPGVYFNVAGYRIDWDNLQVSARTSGTGSVFGLIANAGAARIYGAEAELSATPVTGLMLAGNVGFTDAKLSKDQVSTIVTATGRKGDRLAYVPRLTASVSADYTTPLSDTLELTMRADASHVGSSWSTLAPADVFRRFIPAYEVVNLRAGMQGPDGDWGVYLYVANLLDDVAINSASSSSNTGGKTLTFSLPPRTFGMNFTKRF